MKIHPNKNYRWMFFVCFGFIAIISIFLRFWYLDRIPTGLVTDELEYILNAKTLYHTGGSVSSEDWSFWSFTTVPGEMPKGEFPYIISLPFVGPFGLSIFTARIGYAIISVLYVLIIFLIAKTLFGSWCGIASGFLAAINPWSVYYGRTAYDVPVAITAFLLFFYLIIRLKGPKLLIAVIPLFIAFYSYIGTKVLFLPFVFLSILGSWFTIHKRREGIWLTLILVLSMSIFSIFIFRIRTLDANTRMGQIYTPFDQSVTYDVNSQRRLTLESPLTALFANKAVVYAKNVLNKFTGAFSPTILFTNGEGVATFSLWEHGLFYPLDALFLAIGIMALFNTSPAMFLLFMSIIIISVLPSVLSTVSTSYVHRSSLMFPFFLILMGYGIEKTVIFFQNKKRFVIILGIVFVYLILVANFVYLYFFRFPYYNSESFGLSQRLYSRYISLADIQHSSVVIITNSLEEYFRNYLFYNNVLNSDTIPLIRTLLRQQQYKWKNVVFTNVCPTESEIESGITTYFINEESPCKKLFINRSMVVIPLLSDGGTLYRIFNDTLCNKYALSQYPTGFTIDDFKIEKHSEKLFCERFIIKYTEPLYLPSLK